MPAKKADTKAKDEPEEKEEKEEKKEEASDDDR